MISVIEFSDADAQQCADSLKSVAQSISQGRLEDARANLHPFAFQVWEGRTVRAASSGNVVVAESALPREARKVTDQMRAQVFMRDGFRCMLCGGKTIPRNVLVALSDVFPEELPYNRNYKRGFTHPAYWFLAPEADHIMAHSRGGVDSLDNLTTLHARCNTSKSDSILDLPALASDDHDWDGLLENYQDIVALGNLQGQRHSSPKYHDVWLRRYAGGLASETSNTLRR